MKLKGWNLFEILWLAGFTTIILILALFWQSSFLAVTVYITGVFCVVLAAKGNIWNYAFGIYNSIGYAWLSFQNGFYGEVMLNLLFFIPTGVIGWIMWKNKMREKTVIMRKMTWQVTVAIVALCVMSTVFYGMWLSTLKGQNIPYLDALNVVASVIATLAMIGRYREQWILYIAINVAETIMWIMRMISGNADAATMMVMWIAYLVNSIYGLYVWSKGSRKSTLSKEQMSPSVAARG
jgi:nicotinamide mononucleotide transporter